MDGSELTTVDVSRMASGYALHLTFTGRLTGPCMRCLDEASIAVEVDAREVDQAGAGEELDSPYVDAEELRVGAWAHDALALALPAQLVCRPDCAGLCPVCGADRNSVACGHGGTDNLDPRWAGLADLRTSLQEDNDARPQA